MKKPTILVVFLASFAFLGVFFPLSTYAQYDPCNPHSSSPETCAEYSDCHFCQVEGLCKDKSFECVQCVDLNEDDCDLGLNCYWCRNKNLCLEDHVSCSCGDGYKLVEEECDPAAFWAAPEADPNCVDCECVNGTVSVDGVCTCDGDEDCDDGLSCNGSETCSDGECIGGSPVSCTDDSLDCNGIEYCDWFADACQSPGVPTAGGLSFGDDTYGQLGDSTSGSYRTDPFVFASDDVIGLAAGGNHSLFVTVNGALFAMGRNNRGQLGDGTQIPSEIPIEIVSSGVTQVAAGKNHSLFVKEDGSLWGMGGNQNGQLGSISGDKITAERLIRPGFGIRAVACGNYHSLFITSTGDLYAMGNNGAGQLGLGERYDFYWPAKVDAGGSVVAIAAGKNNSALILDDGTLKVMGANTDGQLGDSSIALTEDAITPNPVDVADVVDVAVGDAHIAFVTGDGELYTMGDNEYGQLGTGDNVDSHTPVSIVSSGVIAVTAGANYTLFIKEYEDGVNYDRALYGMGATDVGQLGDDSQAYYNTPIQIGLTRVQQVAASTAHNLVMQAIPGSCMIDDSCVEAGATAPGEPCMICNPDISRTSWTLNDGGSCDDGVFCNGPDQCTGEVCINIGPALTCDDSVDCTDDSCDEDNDQCVNTPNDGNCDDSVDCTDDTCDATNDCQYTPNDGNCDDSVDCTDDTCDATNDCQYTPNDGNCDDSVDCTDDTCDAVSDCQYTPNDGNCDDSVDCTDDTCDAVSDCQYTPNDGNCSDGVYCNGAETCDATNDCQAGTAIDCDDSVGCTEDICDETNDRCLNLPDDSVCDNGDFCDGEEVCDTTNDCVAGQAPCEDDGQYCNGNEGCDEQIDSCTHSGNPCDEEREICDEINESCYEITADDDDDDDSVDDDNDDDDNDTSDDDDDDDDDDTVDDDDETGDDDEAPSSDSGDSGDDDSGCCG